MNDAEFEQYARDQLMRELSRVPLPPLPQRRASGVHSVGILRPSLALLLVVVLVLAAGMVRWLPLGGGDTANQHGAPLNSLWALTAEGPQSQIKMINQDTGALDWSASIESLINQPFDEPELLALTPDGQTLLVMVKRTLYALNSSDGSQRWSLSFRDTPPSWFGNPPPADLDKQMVDPKEKIFDFLTFGEQRIGLNLVTAEGWRLYRLDLSTGAPSTEPLGTVTILPFQIFPLAPEELDACADMPDISIEACLDWMYTGDQPALKAINQDGQASIFNRVGSNYQLLTRLDVPVERMFIPGGLSQPTATPTPPDVAETADPTPTPVPDQPAPIVDEPTPAPTIMLGPGEDSVFGSTAYWQMPWVQFGEQLAVINDDSSLLAFGNWRSQATLLYALPRVNQVPLGIGVDAADTVVLIDAQTGALVQTPLRGSSLSERAVMAPDNGHIAFITRLTDQNGQDRTVLQVLDVLTGVSQQFLPESFNGDPASTLQMFAWTNDGLWIALVPPGQTEAQVVVLNQEQQVFSKSIMVDLQDQVRINNIVAERSLTTLPDFQRITTDTRQWLGYRSPDGAWAFMGATTDGSAWSWSLIPTDSSNQFHALTVLRETAATPTMPSAVRWSANSHYVLVERVASADSILVDVFNVDGEHVLTKLLPSTAQSAISNSGKLLVLNQTQLFVQPLTLDAEPLIYTVEAGMHFIER